MKPRCRECQVMESSMLTLAMPCQPVCRQTERVHTRMRWLVVRGVGRVTPLDMQTDLSPGFLLWTFRTLLSKALRSLGSPLRRAGCLLASSASMLATSVPAQRRHFFIIPSPYVAARCSVHPRYRKSRSDVLCGRLQQLCPRATSAATVRSHPSAEQEGISPEEVRTW